MYYYLFTINPKNRLTPCGVLVAINLNSVFCKMVFDIQQTVANYEFPQAL